MPPPQSLPWMEPLDVAAAIDEEYWVLLYSAVRTGYSGRYSYLAHRLRERIESADFSAFGRRLSHGGPSFSNAWFGYLGYGLKDSLEALTPDLPGRFDLPHLCMMQFDAVYVFDHEQRTVTLWSDQAAAAMASLAPATYPTVVSMHSNMTSAEYLKKAACIIERIREGDLYQANLTRKYGGRFSTPPPPFALFRGLCEASPAPYSAFLKLGDTAVLSSSPELFLHIDAQGHMRARPIKGTAPRFSDAGLDRRSREALAASAKDRAENLMIADLMRNDLSRSCAPGSVTAESLFDVTSHATIHHMSSTVTGQKRGGISTLDAVRHCFPPGSMTGAPKIKAMNLCSEMETLARGVYSGAIGWFGGDGACELSVVIRTLLLKGDEFEFQVGGGIVADSTPEGELNELIDKSKGIAKTLGISAADLTM